MMVRKLDVVVMISLMLFSSGLGGYTFPQRFE